MNTTGMAPTVYEIAAHFRIKTSTVFAHLKKPCAAEAEEKDPSSRRTPGHSGDRQSRELGDNFFGSAPGVLLRLLAVQKNTSFRLQDSLRTAHPGRGNGGKRDSGRGYCDRQTASGNAEGRRYYSFVAGKRRGMRAEELSAVLERTACVFRREHGKRGRVRTERSSPLRRCCRRSAVALKNSGRRAGICGFFMES